MTSNVMSVSHAVHLGAASTAATWFDQQRRPPIAIRAPRRRYLVTPNRTFVAAQSGRRDPGKHQFSVSLSANSGAKWRYLDTSCEQRLIGDRDQKDHP